MGARLGRMGGNLDRVEETVSARLEGMSGSLAGVETRTGAQLERMNESLERIETDASAQFEAFGLRFDSYAERARTFRNEIGAQLRWGAQ